MGFNWDLAASVGLFVGLLAVYAALLQLAHLRHHELSLECFRMREAVTALAERIRSLKVSRDLTEESGRSLSGLQKDFDANLSACGMVFERYLCATRAIKVVACGLAVTLLIGLVLGCSLLSVLYAWAWIPVIALPVLPALIGTWHLLVGDLWRAEGANKKIHHRFIQSVRDLLADPAIACPNSMPITSADRISPAAEG